MLAHSSADHLASQYINQMHRPADGPIRHVCNGLKPRCPLDYPPLHTAALSTHRQTICMPCLEAATEMCLTSGDLRTVRRPEPPAHLKPPKLPSAFVGPVATTHLLPGHLLSDYLTSLTSLRRCLPRWKCKCKCMFPLHSSRQPRRPSRNPVGWQE
ncbi:unnamed protein product [Protopolystoma xenopodis]|uniref:Uncharacterized protein n=1 Tax=Protopolystoma xenopodis TaxID=117903 RepID=A0A448WV37_9PLAT|nr:unnamed protein product [Protopolystoma xenopodis]